AVSQRNRPTQALLLNAKVQDLSRGSLVLAMPTAPLVKQLAQQRRLDFVREALREVLGGEWEIHCVEDGATSNGTGRQRSSGGPPPFPPVAQPSAPRTDNNSTPAGVAPSSADPTPSANVGHPADEASTTE